MSQDVAGSNPAMCKSPRGAIWIAHPVPNWKAVGSSPIVGELFSKARVAQWIACLTSDQEVAGSSPAAGTILKIES